jgi:hypothetical protein
MKRTKRGRVSTSIVWGIPRHYKRKPFMRDWPPEIILNIEFVWNKAGLGI